MITPLLSNFAAHCGSNPNFFDFPTWYKYIKVVHDPGTNRCEIPATFAITDLSLVALALVDIAFRIAALVTVAYVVWGGIQMVLAQGEPDKFKKGRQTVINAFIGLAICLISVGAVAFIGSKVG